MEGGTNSEHDNTIFPGISKLHSEGKRQEYSKNMNCANNLEIHLKINNNINLLLIMMEHY